MHPVRQVRVGLPACRHPPQGLRQGSCWPMPRRPSSPWTPSSRNSPGMAYTVQVAPEDCTGCTLCVEVCPAKDKTQVGRKAINMAPQPPLREQEARQLGFLHDHPGPGPQADQSVHHQEFAAAAPAVRILRRLRRLRRDALRQAGLAAVRRPQRSLPTPPAAPPSTAATCRPPRGLSRMRRARPGLVQLAVRRQRRVRPGHAPDRSTSRTSTPASCLPQLREGTRRRTWSTRS